MRAKNFSLYIISFSLVCVLLSGCMAIDPYSGEQRISDTTIGTGVGAASGAIIGGIMNGEKGALIGAAVGGLAGAGVGYSMDQESAELRQRLMGTGVQVRKYGNSIQLCMASDITFKTDSADIKSSFYPTLESVAMVLKKYSHNNIVVSGHTDNTGNAEHNQELSEQRARSVADYLISQVISPNRIFTQGFGAREPIASNATAAGRLQNRRVVITLRDSA